MTMANTDLDFHHMGVAVPDLDRAIGEYARIFGAALQSGPFDDHVQRVRVCFVAAPDQPSIELIAPLGEDSPVKRLLAGGGGAYHFCYSVADIQATVLEMRARGCLLINGPVPAIAFGGRRIAWMYTPAHQLFELLESAARTDRGSQLDQA